MDVVVQFASGRVTRVNNVAANQTVRLLESAGGFAAPRAGALVAADSGQPAGTPTRSPTPIPVRRVESSLSPTSFGTPVNRTSQADSPHGIVLLGTMAHGPDIDPAARLTPRATGRR